MICVNLLKKVSRHDLLSKNIVGAQYNGTHAHHAQRLHQEWVRHNVTIIAQFIVALNEYNFLSGIIKKVHD